MAATRALSASLQHLNRTLQAGELADRSDAELVALFVERRDEAAFAALVRRHGTLVLGVCRRVLRHEQDAEDAFQATFLVFARDARRVGRAGAIGNWLYGVAVNVSRKARAARYRREVREADAASRRPDAVEQAAPDDLREVLDRELNALPGKYRAAVVLCDLMGLTTQQAAEETGCPPKTLGTRLSRGRSLLASRLTRRGVALGAGGLLAVLPQAASAAVPPQLIESTARTVAGIATGSAPVPAAVAALTNGVSNAMFLKTIKFTAIACAALVVGGFAMHGGFATHASAVPGTAAGKPGARPARPVDFAAAHIHAFFKHVDEMLDLVGLGSGRTEVVTADDKKDDKDKPALTGVWVKKDGEMKIDFTEKNAISLFPHGENKVIVIQCEYTQEKDGVVKAKITGFDGKEEAKKMIAEKIPVGTEFSFKWTVKGDAAKLEDVKGAKDGVELLKSHLEAEYSKK